MGLSAKIALTLRSMKLCYVHFVSCINIFYQSLSIMLLLEILIVISHLILIGEIE